MDGKGPATITDMMVELIPNKENYEDVYPSDSEDEDAGDSNDEQAESDTESDNIRPLKGEVEKMGGEWKKVKEKKGFCNQSTCNARELWPKLGNKSPQGP